MNKKIRKNSKVWCRQQIIAHITKERGQLKLVAAIYDILISYYKSRTFSFRVFKNSLPLNAFNGYFFRSGLARRIGVSPHKITVFRDKNNLIIKHGEHQHFAFDAIAQAIDVKTFQKYKHKIKEWEILKKDVSIRIELLTKTKRILDKLLDIYGVKTKSQKWRKQEVDFSEKYGLSVLYIWNIVEKL